MKKAEIAQMIDHTLLIATATSAQVKEICAQATQYGFASVCINPCYVPLVAKELAGTQVKTCTVIGFPLGANTLAVKAFETADAVASGADEIDMVINVGAAKEGNFELVEREIKAVVEAAAGKLVKVIIETCYLTDEEKQLACKAAVNAGANFVKTSTGFGTGGATAHDVQLMKSSITAHMCVKASGGVRDYDGAVEMINAGASRVGASAGIAIVEKAE